MECIASPMWNDECLFKLDWNKWPRCSLWQHCLHILFPTHLLGPHQNYKEILIVLIPDHSIFKRQDICNHTHRGPEHITNISMYVSISIHLLPCFPRLSFTFSNALIVHLLILALPLWLCPFLMYVSMGLFPCYPPPPPHHQQQTQGRNVPDSGVIVIKCVQSSPHKALMRGGE